MASEVFILTLWWNTEGEAIECRCWVSRCTETTDRS